MLKHLTTALLICMLPAAAFAGGFELPSNGAVALGRGGAFTARADDLVCLEYNPAGLIKLPGNHVYVGNNLVQYDLTYTGIFPDGGAATPVSNESGPMTVAPFVAVSSDFGLRDWRFALGVFGPSANGILDLAEDPSGSEARRPHHYLMQDMNVLMAFYTASVAYGREESWGIGLDFHWVDLLSAELSLWADAYDPELPKNSWFQEDGMDVLARTKVSDHTGFAFTLGGWYKPIRNLELGLSLRVPNIHFNARGTTTLAMENGMLQNLYDSGIESEGAKGLVAYDAEGQPTGAEIPTTLKFSYPMTARFGIRYVHEVEEGKGTRELFDVEVDAVWEGWSVLERYEVQLEETMKILEDPPFFTLEPGAKTQFNFQTLEIPRHYKDTWSVRLGGQYAPLHWLTLRAGTYFETGAVPKAYTNVDFASFDRIGAAVGISGQFRWFTLSLGYSHVFQATREVSLEETKVYKAFALRPDAPTATEYKVGAGTFETGYDLFSVGLAARF